MQLAALKTKPWDVATAGGCLGSHYLAAWVIARLAGWKAKKQAYVERAAAAVRRYLPTARELA